MFCSQPKRGALRRQAHIDQHTQEQLQDPWVRLSESSPEELSKIHHHHRHHNSADRSQPTTVHSQPAIMSDEENTTELNGTTTDVASDPPADKSSENTSETPPEAKKGPPVAPKPTWFRQSLKKIRNEQGQKKQDIQQNKTAEQRPTGGFTRTFGGRSASSTANLSIKQKIHSFETFSSPEGPEKGDTKRPVAPSTSLPLVEKESRSHTAPHVDNRKGKDEIPKEIQPNQSPSVRMTDNTTVSATPSTITSSPSEACIQTTAESSEDEPPPAQSPTDVYLSDRTSTVLVSGIQDSYDDRNVLPSKQEPELDRENLSRTTESMVLPPVTPVKISQAEGESPAEGMEEDVAQSQVQLVSTTLRAAPLPDSHLLRGPEEESLGKIIAFSNQVICHVRIYGNVLCLRLTLNRRSSNLIALLVKVFIRQTV